MFFTLLGEVRISRKPNIYDRVILRLDSNLALLTPLGKNSLILGSKTLSACAIVTILKDTDSYNYNDSYN